MGLGVIQDLLLIGGQDDLVHVAAAFSDMHGKRSFPGVQCPLGKTFAVGISGGGKVYPILGQDVGDFHILVVKGQSPFRQATEYIADLRPVGRPGAVGRLTMGVTTRLLWLLLVQPEGVQRPAAILQLILGPGLAGGVGEGPEVVGVVSQQGTHVPGEHPGIACHCGNQNGHVPVFSPGDLHTGNLCQGIAVHEGLEIAHFMGCGHGPYRPVQLIVDLTGVSGHDIFQGPAQVVHGLFAKILKLFSGTDPVAFIQAAAGFWHRSAEQTFSQRGGQQHSDGHTACGLAKDQDPLGVAAEAFNVFLDPPQSGDLIQQTHIAGKAVFLPQLGNAEKAQSTAPVIDGHEDRTPLVEGLSIKFRLRAVAAGKAAAIDPEQNRQFLPCLFRRGVHVQVQAVLGHGIMLIRPLMLNAGRRELIAQKLALPGVRLLGCGKAERAYRRLGKGDFLKNAVARVFLGGDAPDDTIFCFCSRTHPRYRWSFLFRFERRRRPQRAACLRGYQNTFSGF